MAAMSTLSLWYLLCPGEPGAIGHTDDPRNGAPESRWSCSPGVTKCSCGEVIAVPLADSGLSIDNTFLKCFGISWNVVFS